MSSAGDQYRDYVDLDVPDHIDGLEPGDDEPDEDEADGKKKSTAKKTSAKK
jgi:hypothetical protein